MSLQPPFHEGRAQTMTDSIPDDGQSVPANERDASAADAAGAADDALTTLPDGTQIAEDGVGASAAGAPDVDMATVTDTTPKADSASDPDSTRPDPGGLRDRASRGYGPRDAAELRRRQKQLNEKRRARKHRR